MSGNAALSFTNVSDAVLKVENIPTEFWNKIQVSSSGIRISTPSQLFLTVYYPNLTTLPQVRFANENGKKNLSKYNTATVYNWSYNSRLRRLFSLKTSIEDVPVFLDKKAGNDTTVDVIPTIDETSLFTMNNMMEVIFSCSKDKKIIYIMSGDSYIQPSDTTSDAPSVILGKLQQEVAVVVGQTCNSAEDLNLKFNSPIVFQDVDKFYLSLISQDWATPDDSTGTKGFRNFVSTYAILFVCDPEKNKCTRQNVNDLKNIFVSEYECSKNCSPPTPGWAYRNGQCKSVTDCLKTVGEKCYPTEKDCQEDHSNKGPNYNLLIWIVIGVMLVIGVVAYLVLRKKKSKR